MDNAEKFKELFLKNDLFEQFREQPENLEIIIREEGTLCLKLTNFKGLNTNMLNGRAFHTLEVEDLNLKSGHIMSGGPEGIIVQYMYEFTPQKQNKNKP